MARPYDHTEPGRITPVVIVDAATGQAAAGDNSDVVSALEERLPHNAANIPKFTQVDELGDPLSYTGSSTGPTTQAASPPTSIVNIAENSSRAGYVINNKKSSVDCYILYATTGTPSATNWDDVVEAGERFQLDGYTGPLRFVWASNGSGRVSYGAYA